MKAFYQFSTPSEFWPLAPVETNAFIEARSRHRIVMAWQNAAMNRLAKTKHFPKSPGDLLEDKSKPKAMSVDSIVAFGQAMKSMHEKSKNGR
jgi:hypothetical protein